MWANLNSMDTPKTKEDVLIWNNKDIRVDQRPVYYGHFHTVDIETLADLYISDSTQEAFDFWKAKGLKRLSL